MSSTRGAASKNKRPGFEFWTNLTGRSQNTSPELNENQHPGIFAPKNNLGGSPTWPATAERLGTQGPCQLRPKSADSERQAVQRNLPNERSRLQNLHAGGDLHDPDPGSLPGAKVPVPARKNPETAEGFRTRSKASRTNTRRSRARTSSSRAQSKKSRTLPERSWTHLEISLKRPLLLGLTKS